MTNPELAPDMPEEMFNKIELALNRAKNELDYCVFHFRNGTTPCMWGDQMQASEMCAEAVKLITTRADLAPQAGSVDVEAVIDAVTSFYTRKEDRNFAAQVARNTLDNLLAGAPVGGDELVLAAQAVIERWDTPAWKDVPATATFINRLRDALKQSPRPAIPGLQEAISDALPCVGCEKPSETNTADDAPICYQCLCGLMAEELQTARQSGVPEGYKLVPIPPKTFEEAVERYKAHTGATNVELDHDPFPRYYVMKDGKCTEIGQKELYDTPPISAARDGRD